MDSGEVNVFRISCFHKKLDKQFYLVLEISDEDHEEICNFLLDKKFKLKKVTEEFITKKNTDPFLKELFPVYYFLNDEVQVIKDCLIMEEKI